MEQHFNGIILDREGHQQTPVKIWAEDYYSVLCDGNKHPKYPEDVQDLTGTFFGHIEMKQRHYICWN